MFPASTAHTKMMYSSSNLKTSIKASTGNKSHDVQEALKKKQVTVYMLAFCAVIVTMGWILCSGSKLEMGSRSLKDPRE